MSIKSFKKKPKKSINLSKIIDINETQWDKSLWDSHFLSLSDHDEYLARILNCVHHPKQPPVRLFKDIPTQIPYSRRKIGNLIASHIL